MITGLAGLFPLIFPKGPVGTTWPFWNGVVAAKEALLIIYKVNIVLFIHTRVIMFIEEEMR
jgi:hypothetical protein